MGVPTLQIQNFISYMKNAGITQTMLEAIVNSAVDVNDLTMLHTQGQYGLPKIKKVSGLTGLATAAETDTAWDLPAKAVIYDVYIDVTTAVSAKTIDIGTLSTDSGDADGFADALSVASTGIVRPQAAVTTGSNETYYSGNTRGALLCDYLVGTDVDGDFGLYREKPCTAPGSVSVTYTPATGTAALVFDLYIVYAEVG